ncbi:hypothetical protein ACNOYE_22625 [Nannocystaceae bacterium ST9]
MPRLIPCPACQSHVFANDRSCPHCGAELRSGLGKSAAVLVGLALTGCPTVEPVYGVPESGSDTADTSGETADTDTSTGTDTGEPEYGVPDTGVDTSTDTGTDTGEPEYGVPDTGTDTTSG